MHEHSLQSHERYTSQLTAEDLTQWAHGALGLSLVLGADGDSSSSSLSEIPEEELGDWVASPPGSEWNVDEVCCMRVCARV